MEVLEISVGSKGNQMEWDNSRLQSRLHHQFRLFCKLSWNYKRTEKKVETWEPLNSVTIVKRLTAQDMNGLEYNTFLFLKPFSQSLCTHVYSPDYTKNKQIRVEQHKKVNPHQHQCFHNFAIICVIQNRVLPHPASTPLLRKNKHNWTWQQLKAKWLHMKTGQDL